MLQQNPTESDLRNALGGVETGINNIRSNPLLVLVQGQALDELEGMRSELQAALARQAANTPAVNAAQDTSEKALINLRGNFNSNPTREDLRNRIAANKAALKNAKGSDIARLSRDIGVDQRRLAKRIADAAAQAKEQAAALTRAVRGVSDTIQSNKPVVNLTVPVATYINGRLIESNLNRYQTVVGGQAPFQGQLGGA